MCDGWDIKEDRVSSPLGQNWRLKLKLIGGNCTKVSGSQTPVQFTEPRINYNSERSFSLTVLS